MAECRWCDKSLPGDAIPACGSCWFKSRDEADPTNDDAPSQIIDEDMVNYDLSSLAKDRDTLYSKGNSKDSVKSTLLTNTIFQEHVGAQEIPMKKVKIRSNSIRGRQFVLDTVVLAFDEDGFAEINESDLSVIEEYSAVRPNRLFVVREEPEQKKEVAKPAPSVKKTVKKEEEPEAKKKASSSTSSRKSKKESTKSKVKSESDSDESEEKSE